MRTIMIRLSTALLAAAALTAAGPPLPASASAAETADARLMTGRPVPAQPAEPAPGEPETREYQCGSAGLWVVAKSADDKENACERAKKVAKAAIEGSAPGPDSGSGLTVEVDGQQWSCQSRQGDDEVNPHSLCASLAQEEEQVRLYS
ncbi:hypothetical protein [Nonomuraea candida]|uniref:hypothetical protein n=1 Tax=Nonomuraea candida TaxID=359159 RepID=UPI0005BD8A84|nr:hypothetical protein [Nonomuraea candida]